MTGDGQPSRFATADYARVDDPRKRNLVWRAAQVVLQCVVGFWLRYRARGIETLPAGGALLISNHQSFLDPLLVGVALRRPVSFIARDSLFRIPFVGWMLRKTYVLPINRDAPGSEAIRECARRMQMGYYVGIFPEGTRTRDGTLGEMKPGFLAMARRAGVPIVPVGIAGAFEAFPRGKIVTRPRTVRVVFGPAIQGDELHALLARGQESALLADLERRVKTCLDEAAAWIADSQHD